MAKFNLEIDEDDLQSIKIGLVHYLSSATFQMRCANDITEYTRVLLLMRRLSEASRLPEGQAAQPQPAGMPAAVSSTRAPVTSRKNPSPAPVSETGELTITPVKVEQSQEGKSMVVHYRVRNSKGVRETKIRCWDPSQFGDLLASVGQPTTFLTKTTKEGFTNIVGVKR